MVGAPLAGALQAASYMVGAPCGCPVGSIWYPVLYYL